jgi:hypothetical protein
VEPTFRTLWRRGNEADVLSIFLNHKIVGAMPDAHMSVPAMFDQFCAAQEKLPAFIIEHAMPAPLAPRGLCLSLTCCERILLHGCSG